MRAKYPIGPITHTGAATITLVNTEQIQDMTAFAGNSSIVLPNAQPGTTLTFLYLQDAVGGRVVSFDGAAVTGGAVGCGPGVVAAAVGASERTVYRIYYGSARALIARTIS